MEAATTMRLGGIVGQRAENNIAQWLSIASFSNSAIFSRYRYRDLPQDIYDVWFTDRCGFAAEFPGKLLVSVCECLKLAPGDERLLKAGAHIVQRLKACGIEEGYLGLFASDERYIGHDGRREWDIWGAYHAMWGLLLWADVTGDTSAFDLCLSCADALCAFVLDQKHNLCEAEETFANLSGGRIFCVLFERTGNRRYWDTVHEFVVSMQRAGFDVMNGAFRREHFHQMCCGNTGARWELLHAIVMLEDLYRVSGDERYADALRFYWKDILVADVHNTGGYSSGEGSCGNPYDLRAVELCCSIMWADLTCAYWRVTRDPYAADELERTLYNALLGSQHPTGRWWTYSSPMCGQKKPVEDVVVYQGFHFDGCHEMNCCSANSGRGIGQLGNWAAFVDADTVYVNYYGEGDMVLSVAGSRVLIEQHTIYPRGGRVECVIKPDRPMQFTLLVRIPHWAPETKAFLNGNEVACSAGQYLELKRLWQVGDEVVLHIDMSPHFWIADERLEGLASIYYGPLLLAFDHGRNRGFCWEHLRIERYGERNAKRSYYQSMSEGLKLTLDDTRLDSDSLRFERVDDDAYPEPVVRLRVTTDKGETLYLIDYMTAGMDNDWFTTWFDIPKLRGCTGEGESIWNVRIKQ